MNRLIKFLCLNALPIGSASLAMDPNPADQGKQLCYAAKTGNLDLLNQMLDAGYSVETKMNGDSTLLRLAAMNGHAQACLLLLDRKAQVNTKNSDGWTPLMSASNEGHNNVCTLLLDRNAQVDSKDNDGWTPLMSAAFRGHEDVCQQLLDHNAQVDAKTPSGMNPMALAAHFGRVTICRLLINTTLDRGILPGSMVTLLGIKKFRNTICLDPIDRHIINNIASQACATAPKIKELFAQIDAIKNETLKNNLRAYAQLQLKLKMDQKTNNGDSHE